MKLPKNDKNIKPRKWVRRRSNAKRRVEDPYFIEKEKRILEHTRRIDDAKDTGLL